MPVPSRSQEDVYLSLPALLGRQGLLNPNTVWR